MNIRAVRWLAAPLVVAPLAVGCKFGHQTNCVPDHLVTPPVTASDPKSLVLSPSLTTKSGPAEHARLVMFLESKSGQVLATLGALTGADGHGVARLSVAQTLNDEEISQLRTATKYRVQFTPTKQESRGAEPLCDASGSNSVTFTG